MKYKGRQLKGPKCEILVIPREEGDIVFTLEAVADMQDFEEILSPPQPPLVTKPGGMQFKNTEDSSYKKSLEEWYGKRSTWMILKSLAATKDLEWETVKMDDPETWDGFKDELKQGGFNTVEVRLILNAALQINSVDEGKMEEARARFLAQKSQAPQSP